MELLAVFAVIKTGMMVCGHGLVTTKIGKQVWVLVGSKMATTFAYKSIADTMNLSGFGGGRQETILKIISMSPLRMAILF
mgnify:CR=1 FL=1